MGELRITVGDDLHFSARWEAEAPQTIEAIRRMLPIESKLIHCRWTGESTWIPFGDFRPGLDYENHTSHPGPGQLAIYPGGISECEIFFPYGACTTSSKVGQLAANHFATIIPRGWQDRPRVGRRALCEGARRFGSKSRLATGDWSDRGTARIVRGETFAAIAAASSFGVRGNRVPRCVVRTARGGRYRAPGRGRARASSGSCAGATCRTTAQPFLYGRAAGSPRPRDPRRARGASPRRDEPRRGWGRRNHRFVRGPVRVLAAYRAVRSAQPPDLGLSRFVARSWGRRCLPISTDTGGLAASPGLVGATSFALFLVLSRKWGREDRLDGLTIALSTMTVAAISLGLLVLVTRPGSLVPAELAPEALAAMGWLVVAAAGGQAFAAASVRLIPASRSAAFLLLKPIVARCCPSCADERPSGVQIVGGGLVLAGIAAATLRGRGDRLVLRGGTVVTAERSRRADVALTNGATSGSGRSPWCRSERRRGHRRERAIVLPGAVDVHTHTRVATDASPIGSPGLRRRRLRRTRRSSRSQPGTLDAAGRRSLLTGLREWRRDGGRRRDDFGVSLAISGRMDDPWRSCRRWSTRRVDSEGLQVFDFRLDDRRLFEAMRALGGRGGIPGPLRGSVLIDSAVADALARGDTARSSTPPRSTEAEEVATRRVMAFARAADVPVHVVHLSSRAALRTFETRRRWRPRARGDVPALPRADRRRYGAADPAIVAGA